MDSYIYFDILFHTINIFFVLSFFILIVIGGSLSPPKVVCVDSLDKFIGLTAVSIMFISLLFGFFNSIHTIKNILH